MILEMQSNRYDGKSFITLGLEKSVKDLQRQTTALTRIKMTFEDEMERAFKQVSHIFEEFHTA